jgi:hypothetical protein
MPRRLYLKNVCVAYPGTLGDGLPEPPYGYQFLTDDLGNYLTDDLGNYLVVPWNG